jgi:ATP-dependent RNA helicase RhlE
LLSNIAAMGYETPTPIQEQAMPSVMEGRDVMGLAQTGTGKTAAFLLPILQRLISTRPASGPKRTRALIVAPTRELAEQIHEAAKDLGRNTGVRSAAVYGGVGLQPQARALRSGVELVVACPGRLLDHVRQGSANLSAVEVLVLDEADHMFDMGFLPDIRKILQELPSDRQTLLFSATMPEAIRRLTKDALTDPVTVRINADAPASTVSHTAYPIAPHQKTSLLMALLDSAKEGSALVFTRTKHQAKKLAALMEQAGLKAASLQGNLSQRQRQAALDGFRDGTFKVLAATDIAARGIDVSRVAHVINFDMPSTPEAYTHRIGRTGRAEREGRAHSLVTNEDMSMVRAIERLLGKPMERRMLADFDYRSIAPAGAPRGERTDNRPRPNQGARNGGGDRNGGWERKREDRAQSSEPRRSTFGIATPNSRPAKPAGKPSAGAPNKQRQRRPSPQAA